MAGLLSLHIVITYTFVTSAAKIKVQSMQRLANKQILLGVTGSIAAYKSADLVRRLREVGATVRVVMTTNAKRFITPLTLQAVSGYPVHDDLFDLRAEAAMGHIELARWADVVLVAPASADFMVRLLHGQADDLLTTLCLATAATIAIAPAMNQGMWRHPITQENQLLLQQKGVLVMETGEGSQACGDVGPGRMLEPLDIVEKVSALFATGALDGQRVLVTAGPTHEAIDPIRYISNKSSGKMGYALAASAAEAGAKVTLISGPVQESVPSHVTVVPVVSAAEMHAAVMKKIADCDIFLAVAAVSDYHCATIATHKIHKDEATFALTLERNPDIVSAVSALPQKPFIVGFAAETAEDYIARAKAKRAHKNMDMIIANRVGEAVGMGSDDNAVTVCSKTAEITLPLMSKQKLARELIAIVADAVKKRKS